jgi:hypothetical protein
MHIACSDSGPCRNVTLSGVQLLPAQGKTLLMPFCWEAYGSSTHTGSTLPSVSCLLNGLPKKIAQFEVDHHYQC